MFLLIRKLKRGAKILKKTIIGLIVFTIVAVSTTVILIIEENKIKNVTPNIPKEEIETEIGTKRNQKYNQNDLEIIRKNVDGIVEYQSIRISGLKNKEIENKINNEIAQTEEEFVKLLSNFEEGEHRYINEYVAANFSNILSISMEASSYSSFDSIEKEKYLNYDLTTGNKIELKDLFLPNADIDRYAREYIYKDALHEAFSKANVFFDNKYWEDGKCTYFTNELDEANYIKRFTRYKNAKKDFYIGGNYIYIQYGKEWNDSICIKYKDCLNDLVVYTKFVTKDSIFERDDIGFKDLYVCSIVEPYTEKYSYNVGDVTSNFRIDSRMQSWVSGRYESGEIFNSIFKTAESEVKNKKTQVLLEANKNDDKYYYLGISTIFHDITIGTPGTEDIVVGFVKSKIETLYEVSMDDFKNFFEEKMVDACTNGMYYNDEAFYLKINLNDEEKNKCKCYENVTTEVYRASDGEKINSLDDLFVIGYDYISVIQNKLLERGFTKEEILEKIQNQEYTILKYGVEFKKSDDETCFVDYSDFSAEGFKH